MKTLVQMRARAVVYGSVEVEAETIAEAKQVAHGKILTMDWECSGADIDYCEVIAVEPRE